MSRKFKCLISLLVVFLCVNVVYCIFGVDLEFPLNIVKIGNNYYYQFYTYVSASQHSKDVFKSQSLENGIIAGKDFIIPEKYGAEYKGGIDYYDVSGIIFQKYASKYSEYSTFDIINTSKTFFYDIVNMTTINPSNPSEYFNKGKTSPKNKVDTVRGDYGKSLYDVSEKDRKLSKLPESYTYYEKMLNNVNESGTMFYTEYTLTGKSNEVVLYRYLINKSYVDKNFSNDTYLRSDKNGDYIRISMRLVIDGTYMYTTDQVYSTLSSNFSRGINNDGVAALGYSAANDMDNKLYIGNEDQAKIYIRYVCIDSEGNKQIRTSDAGRTSGYTITYNDNNSSVGEVSDAGERNTVLVGYGALVHQVSEDYIGEKATTVTIENTLDTFDDGKYKFLGSKLSNEPIDYDNGNVDYVSGRKKIAVQTYTDWYIDFYYSEKDNREINIIYVDESGNLLLSDNNLSQERNGAKNLLYNNTYTGRYREQYFTNKEILISPYSSISVGGKTYSYTNKYQISNKKGATYETLYKSKNEKSGSRINISSDGDNYLVVLVYKEGEVKQPKLFYSYVGVELDEENGGYKFVEKLKGPYEEDNNGGVIYISTKDEKFSGYDPNPLGCVSRLDGEIGTVYEDLFYEDIVNTKLYPVNKEKGINFEGAKHKDNNSLIVVLYLKYKPITYNLFVYRRAIDENNKIQNENLKIGINPEGNDVQASRGTVKSFVEKEDRKYTITLEDDRKPTTVTVKNILESDMSEDQIIEYKFAGKWSNIELKEDEISKLKDYDSNNGINYHLYKKLNSKNSDLYLYYNEDKPKTVKICPILSFVAADPAFKTDPHKECGDNNEKYNNECMPQNIESIYIPAGEDVTTKIANAPKIMFLNYNDADSYGRRGGIWQKLEKSWVEIDNDILNQYKKAAGIENSKNFGAKELYQKYKDKINSITKDKIVKKENGKYYVMKYKYTIIGHSLLYMDKIYVDSSNNNISSENQVNESTKIKETSVYKKMEEYYAKTSYAVLSQKNNIFGYDKDYTNKVISKLNSMDGNLYNASITIPSDTPNGVNIASARINYVTSRSGTTVFNKNSSISKYLWVDGDSGSNTIIGVPINKKISELYGNTNTSKAGINVLVPANISSVKVEAAGQVNHSDDKDISNAIQNHSNLTVTANMGTPANVYTNITSLKEELLKEKIRSYIKSYVYIFDFNVQRLDGGKPTGEPTKIIKSNSNQISVYVNDDSVENNKNGSAVKDYVNNITVLAFTNNTPPDYYIDNSIQIAMKTTKNEKWKKITYSNEIYSIQNCSEKTTNNIWSKTLVDRNEEISQDAYYVVKASKTIASIGRIYDFRITDCADVDFKSVFRKSGQGQGVNSLTGTVYFSGIKELQIFGNGVNSLDLRKDPNTLPLGPYKHTNSNYVDAPKMGYRISFDVKTTGKYVTTKDDANKLSNNYKKYVKITPSYYYIKKDGSGYNDKITLYYKNSSNKYVKFIGSGFKISYKPNDGYRNVTNLGITNITDMFTDKYVTLEVSDEDGFILNIDSMCTNYYGYVQSWYGEFKLPNTTIAVKNEEGDVNKPLTDGYLGVKFDISCFYEYTNNNEAKTTKKVSYNTLDKNASGTNTTQWDYEGYLGFKNAGKNVTGNDGLYLQFPKGKLLISSQSTYEQIRGTVVFFDLDNRASNDFE